MARIATFTTAGSSHGSYEGRYLYLTIDETVNASENKSILTWTLSVTGGPAGYYYETGPTTIKINGTEAYSKARVGNEFPGVVGSTSGTLAVQHNSDGTKENVSVVFKTAVYWGAWAVEDYGGTINLTPIDRTAPTVTASASAVSTTAIDLTAEVSKSCDAWEYTLDGSTWIQFSTQEGLTQTVRITGLESRVYSAIAVRATRSDNGVSGRSSNITVDLILPTVQASVRDITPGSFTLNVSSSERADRWEYSTDDGVNWSLLSSEEGTSVSGTVTGLSSNTTYYVRARARRKANQLFGQFN